MIHNILNLSAIATGAVAMQTFNAQILQKSHGPGIDRPLINLQSWDNYEPYTHIYETMEYSQNLSLFEQGDNDSDFAWRAMNDFFDLQLYLEVDVGNPA